MKMKIITAIIAFAATFGTSTVLTSFFVEKQTPLISFARVNRDDRVQQNIRALLRQDISNGEKRFDDISEAGGFGEPYSAAFVNAYSKAVNQYSNESASMDDSGLPSDLKAAWRQHMKAWRDYSVYLNQLKKSAQAEQMTSDQIAEKLDDRDNLINRTWYQVLAVADKYDADPYEND